MKRSILFAPTLGLAALAATLLPAPARAQATYAVTDLGTLPGGYSSIGQSVNASGQVAGYSELAGTPDHAFLYSSGSLTDLGTLPGGLYSAGLGINASGQVTGEAGSGQRDQNDELILHAFLYSKGTMTDIGTLGGSASNGYGINASGQIAGAATTTGDAAQHAFLYGGGHMTDLGTLGGGGSFGTAINSSGDVAGYSDTTPSQYSPHAFLYSNGAMTDLGTLPGGFNSFGFAVNDSGQVVGFSESSGHQHYRAFLYKHGHMINLGTLGGDSSYAFSINSTGQIAGQASADASRTPYAFLYSGGRMVNLNSLVDPASGWTLWQASSVSDTGFITGYGTHNNQMHAFLLTPVSATRPAVTSLDPASRTQGREAFTLTVTGTGFASGSIIQWSGAAEATTFVSATKLTAAIPASLIAQAGTAKVTVSTPGVVTSNARTETIMPRPTLLSVSPTSKKAGSGAFALTVNGTGCRPASFYAPTVVKWNGLELATTYVSATQLTAQVPASLLTKSGSATVTVTTPQVATSAGKAFTITP